MTPVYGVVNLVLAEVCTEQQCILGVFSDAMKANRALTLANQGLRHCLTKEFQEAAGVLCHTASSMEYRASIAAQLVDVICTSTFIVEKYCWCACEDGLAEVDGNVNIKLEGMEYVSRPVNTLVMPRHTRIPSIAASFAEMKYI